MRRAALMILAGLAIVMALPVPDTRVTEEDDTDSNWPLEDEDAEIFSVEYLASFDRPSFTQQSAQPYNAEPDTVIKSKEIEFSKIASDIIHDDASFWSPDTDDSLMNDEDIDFANDANVLALLLSSSDPDYNLIEAAILMRKEASRVDIATLWQDMQHMDDDIHSDT
ncbi:hypothetical protein NQZ79_g8505 [Umbelopsis isabellina]|nr:hypothetical protein NQZ79_g8505 [Umbelopsis isabellina]